jgi:hypothetical protein
MDNYKNVVTMQAHAVITINVPSYIKTEYLRDVLDVDEELQPEKISRTIEAQPTALIM